MHILSFSYDVKQELSRERSKTCCQKAELLSIILMAGSIGISGGSKEPYLKIKTEHAAFSRKIYKLLKKYLNTSIKTTVTKNDSLKKNNIYAFTVKLSAAKCFLNQLGLSLKSKEKKLDVDKWPNPTLIKKNCCKCSYLRGAFLGSGSLSDPKGPYHLEIITTNKTQAEELVEIMVDLGLKAKINEQKDKFKVYIKDGDSISDFLGLVGAHKSLLEYENIRVVKDVRNNVNRIVNCETANLNKIVDASLRQISSINYLKKEGVFEKLPDKLKDIAEVRLQYPDLSLKELGQMMTPVLGKSGVSYRLKKIQRIAEKLYLMKKEGEKNDRKNRCSRKQNGSSCKTSSIICTNSKQVQI